MLLYILCIDTSGCFSVKMLILVSFDKGTGLWLSSIAGCSYAYFLVSMVQSGSFFDC
jgi:hypothetical protein